MKSIALAAVILLAACLVATVARRGTKNAFAPRPGDVCSRGPPPEYATADPRWAVGTVDCPRFSPPSQVSLERAASSPEVAETSRELNPYVGLGKTSRVRAWGDPYRGAEACSRRSIYSLQPGEPGYLEPLAMERSPALRSGHCAAPLVSPAAEFRTDGAFGDALASAVAFDPL